MDRTKEEMHLLAKFFDGMIDGTVGKYITTSGGSIVWTAIKDGKIVRYKQGPGRSFFNGKENEKIKGVLHVLNEWKTENEVLDFFREFGFLVEDADVKAYSAKFKTKK